MKVLLPLILLLASVLCQPSNIGIGGLFERSLTNSDTGELFRPPDDILAIETGFRLAVEDINSSSGILPSTDLVPVVFDTQGTVAGALDGLVTADAIGLRVVIGPSFSEQSLISAVASGVYDILLASHSSSAASLSDDSLYPLFVRGVAPDTFQATVIVDLLEYWFDQTKEDNWKEIGIICTADDYGVGGARDIIEISELRGFETIAFQQFLVGATDVSVEIRELGNSGSRVFISYMFASDYQTMIREADEQELIGDFYVWVCSDGCSTESIFEDFQDGRTVGGYQKLSLGLQGILPQGGTGDLYSDYLTRWRQLDPDEYIGAGPGTEPPLFSLIAYEMVVASANAIHDEFARGNFSPNGTELYNTILGITFTTLTGEFILEPNGDRRSNFQVVNVRPDGDFEKSFSWTIEDKLDQEGPTVWHDGTTNIPDIDVREEFDFWSCDDKESGTDVTGKTINLETPDSSDINFIEGDYECDQVIDCWNMSDEGYQCTPSYILAFIFIGILTGFLVIGTIWLIPLACIFGCIIRRHRFFLSGALFLIILTISAIVGFISTYAWYGKAHPVACNFQLWLLGLSAVCMIGAMFAKQFRFWRSTAATSFVRKLTKSDEKGISNPIHPELEFLVYWIASIIIPIFLMLLWTAIATPTADMEDVNGDDHYVCTTGGVTGEPAGLVFFFLIVAYLAVLLICCMVMSFLCRHVPRPFMDKRLTFIAVFNLSFLSAVVIPVFFVLRDISPFAAWMVRTLGILYGFGSTLLIHMIPKIIGLLLDKFQVNTGDGSGAGPRQRPGGGEMDPSMSASNTQSVG